MAATHPALQVPGISALAGYTVAVISERRRHQLCGRLERHGARTVAVQGLRAYSTGDEPELRRATGDALAGPIDELVVASDFGFRAWMRACRRWGVADELVAGFATARLLASNPRAADALRDLGFTDIWSTAESSTEDLVRYLMAQPRPHRRIVVQSDGPGVGELCQALRGSGAQVVEARTYQHQPPAHADLLRKLGEQILNHQLDAVAFTSAAAVDNLLAQAAVDHRRDELLNTLTDEVPALCLGELASAALRAHGVPTARPRYPYLDDLVELAAAVVPNRAVRLTSGRVQIEVRGQAVVINNRLIPVQPGPIAVLRALARQPGRVLSCAEIRRATPSWAGVDDHAIEMAVSRLRRSLTGDGDVIQTVMKRGYRLAA